MDKSPTSFKQKIIKLLVQHEIRQSLSHWGPQLLGNRGNECLHVHPLVTSCKQTALQIPACSSHHLPGKRWKVKGLWGPAYTENSIPFYWTQPRSSRWHALNGQLLREKWRRYFWKCHALGLLAYPLCESVCRLSLDASITGEDVCSPAESEEDLLYHSFRRTHLFRTRYLVKGSSSFLPCIFSQIQGTRKSNDRVRSKTDDLHSTDVWSLEKFSVQTATCSATYTEWKL